MALYALVTHLTVVTASYALVMVLTALYVLVTHLW